MTWLFPTRNFQDNELIIIITTICLEVTICQILDVILDVISNLILQYSYEVGVISSALWINRLRLKIILSKCTQLEIVRAGMKMHNGWIPTGVPWCTRLRYLTLTRNPFIKELKMRSTWLLKGYQSFLKFNMFNLGILFKWRFLFSRC